MLTFLVFFDRNPIEMLVSKKIGNNIEKKFQMFKFFGDMSNIINYHTFFKCHFQAFFVRNPNEMSFPKKIGND